MREEMRFSRDNQTGQWRFSGDRDYSTGSGPIGDAFRAATGRPPKAEPREAPKMIIDGEPVWSITTAMNWGSAGNPGGIVTEPERPDYI